jgi:hypothetical protein
MAVTIRGPLAALLVAGIAQAVPVVVHKSQRIAVEVEKRGCCSHHNGVCGCEDDRAKCCDGTLSPNCGC